MNEECKHGMDPAWCSLCLHPNERDVNPHGNAKYGTIFRAHYDGECCECGFPITRGNIVRVVAGPITNRYAHISCAGPGEPAA